MALYSVHLIDSKGNGGHLSVKDKSSWKTKKSAVKHAKDIANCKVKPWNTVAIEIINEQGELVQTIL